MLPGICVGQQSRHDMALCVVSVCSRDTSVPWSKALVETHTGSCCLTTKEK